MPIPLIIFALIFLLILGILLVGAYFSAVIIFKLLKALFGFAAASPLPTTVKKSLREARHTAELIRKTAQQYPPGPMRDRLHRTIKPVDEWLVNLNRLEHALIKLYTQRNTARELQRATFELEQLRRQLLLAGKEETASLKALLESKRNHQAVLKELYDFQNQAEFKIHKIASDLGTTHTEMLLVTAKGDFNDNRIQRLDESLQDNLSGLRDILTTMDEMGYGRAAG
jgi:hypothetical protein